MSTKIQINSLEALERLIGNDTELEIELRHSVVQDFTKKHLKSIAKAELVASVASAIAAEVKAEFFEELTQGYYTKSVFKRETLEEIKDEIRSTAKAELRKVVEELMEEQKSTERIQKELDSSAHWLMETLAPHRLQAKLDNLVEARLKEKLGLK